MPTNGARRLALWLVILASSLNLLVHAGATAAICESLVSFKGAVQEHPFRRESSLRKDQKLAAIVNATDSNLSAFRARGEKLIQYHGWSDP